MYRFISVFIFVSLILSASSAFARCMSATTWAFPPEKTTIPANAAVFLTGFGGDKAELMDAIKKDVFFKRGKEKIQVRFGPLVESEFRLNGVLAYASKPLTVGKEYTLTINKKTFKWKVAEADHEAPSWRIEPVVSDFTTVRYGCGPAINFNVNASVSDSNASLFEVDLLDSKKNRQRFYVSAKGDMLQIGHGMCSGEFVVKRGERYTATITPIDLAGNRGETKVVTLFEK